VYETSYRLTAVSGKREIGKQDTQAGYRAAGRIPSSQTPENELRDIVGKSVPLPNEDTTDNLRAGPVGGSSTVEETAPTIQRKKTTTAGRKEATDPVITSRSRQDGQNGTEKSTGPTRKRIQTLGIRANAGGKGGTLI
jgi:hypothetical protein